jgi:chromosome segregation ATPase
LKRSADKRTRPIPYDKERVLLEMEHSRDVPRNPRPLRSSGEQEATYSQRDYDLAVQEAQATTNRAESAERRLAEAERDRESWFNGYHAAHRRAEKAEAELRELGEQFNSYAKQADEWIKEAEADRDRLMEIIEEGARVMEWLQTRAREVVKGTPVRDFGEVMAAVDAWLSRASDDGGKR